MTGTDFFCNHNCSSLQQLPDRTEQVLTRAGGGWRLWLHSLKVAQLLRSTACLHTNQSRSYLNHLVFISMMHGQANTKYQNDSNLHNLEHNPATYVSSSKSQEQFQFFPPFFPSSCCRKKFGSKSAPYSLNSNCPSNRPHCSRLHTLLLHCGSRLGNSNIIKTLLIRNSPSLQPLIHNKHDRARYAHTSDQLYRGVIIYTAGLVRLRQQAYNLASTEYNYLTLIILTNYLSVKNVLYYH